MAAMVAAFPARVLASPQYSTALEAENLGDTAAESLTVIGSTYLQCTVVWSVTNSVVLGALQLTTEYSATGSTLRGTGGDVECSRLTGDTATFAFNDVDDRRVLNAAFISLAGIRAPADVFRCALDTSLGNLRWPAPSDFAVTVIDSADPTGIPAKATLGVRLTCSAPCTESAQCGDHDACNGTEACIEGTCAPGLPLACDDGDVCTDDDCSSSSGCHFVLDSANHPACGLAPGWMIGEGQSYPTESETNVVNYAFKLGCDPGEPKNKLRIKWRRNGRKYRFKLEQVQRASCTNNPDIGAEPPVAGFDTHRGQGFGRLKIRGGEPSIVTVTWRFIDATAGKAFTDATDLVVRDANGLAQLDTPQGSHRGNHEARMP